MSLFDYETGDFLRTATPDEVRASVEAAKLDGGVGVFACEAEGGRRCFADGELEAHVVFDDGEWMPAVTLEQQNAVGLEMDRRGLDEIAIVAEGRAVGKVTR